jgi:hypothetical protein
MKGAYRKVPECRPKRVSSISPNGARSNGNGRRLRNVDISDRALLHILLDVADADGLALATDVGDRLGIRGEERKDGTRAVPASVSQRLNWMASYKFVVRVRPEELGLPRKEQARWKLTEAGRMLANGTLPRSIETAVGRMRPGQTLLLMRQLSTTAYVNAPPELATAVRREWQHTAAQRR